MQDKNVLVNGCSFSRGPISWPYHLQKKLNFHLVNLALSGAGNKYIHDSTIIELSKRAYDYVFIMWSGLQRNDVQVGDIAQFDQCDTSLSRSLHNDWPDKIVFPINDQDLVEKNWVFIHHHNKFLKDIKFAEYIKYRNQANETQQSLMFMITLQSFLKQQNIPYVFSFFLDYVEELKTQPDLFNLLDQTNLCIENNIHSIAMRDKSFDNSSMSTNFHPGVDANQQWANILIEFIDAKKT